MKKFLVLLLGVVMALFCFTSCDVLNSVLGGGEDNGVKVYTVEAKFGNSAEINQWKNIYLVDEDTYIITVNAVDSQDPDRVYVRQLHVGRQHLNDRTGLRLRIRNERRYAHPDARYAF